MDILKPQYKENPNEKIDSMYWGMARGGSTTVLAIRRRDDKGNMITTRQYSKAPPLARGQSGNAGVLILGGMETTLDEMRDILQAKLEKKFIRKRGQSEIVAMCRNIQDKRNEAIKHLRKNPSEIVRKPKRVLHLPVGYRMVKTSVEGLKVLARS